MFFRPPVDLSSPQKALASFVAAFAAKDRRALSACVQGGKDSPLIDRLFQRKGLAVTAIGIDRVRIVQRQSSRVTLEFVVSPRMGKMPMDPVQDRIEVARQGKEWKLAVSEATRKSGQFGVVELLVSICVEPEALLAIEAEGKAEMALSNLKMISVAAMNHLTSKDDRFLLTPENWTKELEPFLKNRLILTSPFDAKGTVSFSLNPNLAEETFSKLKNPEKTVLFFEGKVGAPLFRNNGKALIGFADGSVRRLTPEQAKAILWK